MKKFTLKKNYLLLALFLFVTEVLIAVYIDDSIIRPYVGDFLVVILLYCFLKAFVRIRVYPATIAVLIFSYLIELSQYLQLVNYLGLNHSSLARTVMGTSFAWADLLAYTLGIVAVIVIEKIRNRQARPALR